MNIIQEHTYRSATLPEAPARATRAEAEADEERGVELAAFLAILPTLTEQQWTAARGAALGDAWAWASARDAAWSAAWSAGRQAARDAAWRAARGAAWGAVAIVTRDLITPEEFDILTAPMRAAGVNFDALTNHTDGSEA